MRSRRFFFLFFSLCFLLPALLPAAEQGEDLSLLTTGELLIRLQTNSEQMKSLLQTQRQQLEESQSQLAQALMQLDLAQTQLGEAQILSQQQKTQLANLENSLKTTTESFQSYREESTQTIQFLNSRLRILRIGIVSLVVVGAAAVIVLVMAR